MSYFDSQKAIYAGLPACKTIADLAKLLGSRILRTGVVGTDSDTTITITDSFAETPVGGLVFTKAEDYGDRWIAHIETENETTFVEFF